MRVFNLTDEETPELKRRRMFNQTYVVAGKAIKPGGFEDVPNTPVVLKQIEHLIDLGALCLTQVPDSYLEAKKVDAEAELEELLEEEPEEEADVDSEPPPEDPAEF